MTRGVGPTGKGQCGRLLMLFTLSFWRSMFGFGVGSTAMFAQPAVTEVEEMVGLIHSAEDRIQESEYRIRLLTSVSCILSPVPLSHNSSS